MASIGKADTKIIFDEWAKEFASFRPLTKLLWARVNGFVMTGIEFSGLPSASTYYHVRVFVHCFNQDDGETIYFSASRDFMYSLGQHRLGGIRYLGKIEEFPDFCTRIKRETPLGDCPAITDVIDFCEGCSANAHYTIEAIATAWFYLAGFDRSRNYLDSKEQVFFNFPEAYKVLLGGSWSVWRQKILGSLDDGRVSANRTKMLARYARRGLRDYGVRSL